MGSKHRDQVNMNPGPGQYASALNDMSNHQKSTVTIGNEKVRNDLFSIDSHANLPGPGAYSSPNHKVKGFVIGGKAETKISSTPGPGNYQTTSNLVE